MVLLESDDTLSQAPDVLIPSLIVGFKRLLVDDTSLLLQLLIFLLQSLSLLLVFAELNLLVIK